MVILIVLEDEALAAHSLDGTKEDAARELRRIQESLNKDTFVVIGLGIYRTEDITAVEVAEEIKADEIMRERVN